MKSIFLAFSLVFIFSSSLLANHSIDPPTSVKLIAKDFQLFKDKDSQIIYIDFEQLTTNVKALKVVAVNGAVRFQEDVSKNDVNSIYEFNYSEYTAGTYKLELHTYTGQILRSDFVIE